MVRKKTLQKEILNRVNLDLSQFGSSFETQNIESVLNDCFLNSPKDDTQLQSFYMHRSMDNLEYQDLVLSPNPEWEKLQC